jgi:hypothetical protein
MLTENRPHHSLHWDWSMFSSVDPSLAARKMHQNVLSQMAFGMILQDHRQGFLKAFSGSKSPL